MAVSTQEQKLLIKLVIGMLGIAPGHSYLQVVSKGFEDLGHNLQDAASALGNLPQFKALYPQETTASAFATKFLNSMGLHADATAQRLVVDLFNAGVAPEQIILEAVLALSSTAAPEYASARALLENKAEVAYYHAQILGRSDTDFNALAKLLENVTSNPATVAAAQQALNPAPAPEPDTAPAPAPAPAPAFSASKDSGGIASFTLAGTQIDVTEAAGTYTFASSGGNVGSATLAGPLTGMVVTSGTNLGISSALASGLSFPGAGTVTLSDTGAVDAATLKALEAATSGLLDASHLTSVTSATLADARLLLVTNNGASGDKIKTAANVAVTLTDTAATAADLKAIDDATAGLVDASSITSITDATVGTAKQLLVTAASSVTHNAGVAIALTDTSASALDLNAIDAATTGLVSAGSLTSIQGNIADVQTALLAIKANTALSANGLTQATLTNAINATALDGVAFANSTTITLADVSGNALSLTKGKVTAGHTLTIDGSGVSSGSSIEAQVVVTSPAFLSVNTDKLIIKGGAGDDVIFTTQNGVVTTGAGDDVVVFRHNIVGGATTATDYSAYASVQDFELGHDKLGFSASNQAFAVLRSGSSSNTPGLSKQGSSSFGNLNVGDTMVLQDLAKDAGSVGASSSASFFKLSTAVGFNTNIATTFADALGNTVVTGLGQYQNFLVALYDTTYQQMVIGVVNTGWPNDGDNRIDASDLPGVSIVGTVAMTQQDYAAFSASSLATASS